MANIRKGLLQFIFSGAYMKRWNDKLRPTELLEVDKQAHKMFTAWLLCRLNTSSLPEAERVRLEYAVMEGGIFDYFLRLVITDIKPPVFYRIRQNPEHYRQLADWVLEELSPLLKGVDDGLWGRMSDQAYNGVADPLAASILDAAHHYASYWEFKLIEPLNRFDDEMPEIDRSFRDKLASLSYLKGVDELASDASAGPIRRLANLCGQLRFQKRWSQSPRIPETSVMGHMFIVACFAYFCSLAVKACPARVANNFYAGLMHDLPEVLTRDIIFPVKKSVEGLDSLIRQYEEEEVARRILNPLHTSGHDDIASRLQYFLGIGLGSEFTECVSLDGVPTAVSFTDLQHIYNNDGYDPKDGRLLKMCDNLAAFLEAYTAVRNGITSDHLQQAIWRLRHDNRNECFGDLHIGALFADFA